MIIVFKFTTTTNMQKNNNLKINWEFLMNFISIIWPIISSVVVHLKF